MIVWTHKPCHDHPSLILKTVSQKIGLILWAQKIIEVKLLKVDLWSMNHTVWWSASVRTPHIHVSCHVMFEWLQSAVYFLQTSLTCKVETNIVSSCLDNSSDFCHTFRERHIHKVICKKELVLFYLLILCSLHVPLVNGDFYLCF